jgi:hypothetical protein
MARKKKSQREQLVDALRARGLRKKVAEQVASAVGRAPSRKPPKAVLNVVSDLRSLTSEIEDRITGGPAKRKASAKKAANTRKRDAAKRSAAAKKGAQTRAKASATTKRSTTRTTRAAKSGGTRTRAKAKR